MKGYKDYSVAFARSLILKTPPALREVRHSNSSWSSVMRPRMIRLMELATPAQAGTAIRRTR